MARPARRWIGGLGVGALAVLSACSGLGRDADATVASVQPVPVQKPAAAELAQLPDVCRAMPSELVERTLGATGAAVVGPVTVEDGCGWHDSTSGCQLRSLGIEVREGRSAPTAYAAAAAAAVAPEAVTGLGQEAFMTTDLGIMDSTLPMTFVNVLDRGRWLHFTLLGRAGAPGERLLLDVARHVLGAGSG